MFSFRLSMAFYHKSAIELSAKPERESPKSLPILGLDEIDNFPSP
jgi:hypothetical protein